MATAALPLPPPKLKRSTATTSNPLHTSTNQPGSELHTSAIPESSRLPDGFPDHSKYPLVWDYMRALTPAQWDPGLPTNIRIYCYLYRIEPKFEWDTKQGEQTYVWRPTHAIDEEWIGRTFGGHVWVVRLMRGGKDLYKISVRISAGPKDIEAVIAQLEGKKNHTVATQEAAATANGAVMNTPSAFEALERMQTKMFEQFDKMQSRGLDPSAEFTKIIQAQRETLVRPEKAEPGITAKDLFEIAERTRKDTLEFAEKMFRRDAAPAAAPVDPLATLGLFIKGMEMFRSAGADLGLGGAAEAVAGPKESGFMTMGKMFIENIPKISSAVGDVIDRAGAFQRSNGTRVVDANSTPIDAGAPEAPKPTPAGEQTINMPNDAFVMSFRKKAIAKLVMTHLPDDDEEYDDHGGTAADQAADFDPEAAAWLATHVKSVIASVMSGGERPTDVDTDPIFAPFVDRKHFNDFSVGYVQWFVDNAPEGGVQ